MRFNLTVKMYPLFCMETNIRYMSQGIKEWMETIGQ